MATPYDDLYIRSSLDDPGTVPRRLAGISLSPDVIPFGQIPASDPVQYFTANFNKDLGVNITANTANFLYLRGRNQFSGAQNGRAYIYWAQSNLLLYPSVWRQNVLFTALGSDSVDVSAAATGDVWVTPEPFRWIPAMPTSFSNYALIGRVATEQNPNPIPSINNIQDFAAWIAGNGGLGWRNVTTVDAGVTFTVTADYDQGDEGSQMEIMLLCRDLPVGSQVWFTSGTTVPPGNEPISIPPTTITKNPQIIGTSAYIPAGWRTQFSYSYKANGGKPGPGFDLSLRVNYAPMASTALYESGSTLEELGYEDAQVYHRQKKVVLNAAEYYAEHGATAKASGPVRLIVVGADSATTAQ